MYTLLRQCMLCWFGHVSCMEDGQIPKVILYSEFASGKRTIGHPKLCYTDVYKHDTQHWSQANGRSLQMTMVGHNVFSGISSVRQMRKSLAKLRKDEDKDTEKSGAPLGSHRHTDANAATRTVNPTIASSVTPNTAQAAGLILTREHYPWLTPDWWMPTTTATQCFTTNHPVVNRKQEIIHNPHCLQDHHLWTPWMKLHKLQKTKLQYVSNFWSISNCISPRQ